MQEESALHPFPCRCPGSDDEQLGALAATDGRLICGLDNCFNVATGSVKLDHGGDAVRDLDVNEKDVASIKRAAKRGKIAKAVAAVLVPGISFVLGFILGKDSRDEPASTYPLAVAMIGSAPIIGRPMQDLAAGREMRWRRVTVVGVLAASILTFLLGWALGSADSADMESTTKYGVIDNGLNR